jgi:multidrug efflux system membrane fusion protein
MAQFQAMVDQDQAQIDTAKTQLSYTTITAPIDGRTGIRRIDAGNIVHAIDAEPMLVITQLQPISVLFTLPQQALPAVAAAMAAGSAQVLALSEQEPALDSGTLTVVDTQVDAATGTIKLKAAFPNPAGRLWPGGFVRVRLRTETLKDALVVPSAAIQRGPRGPYVFVLDGDTAHRRTVTVGGEDERETVITDGMKPGDVVVTDGASRLSEGTKVSAAGS